MDRRLNIRLSEESYQLFNTFLPEGIKSQVIRTVLGKILEAAKQAPDPYTFSAAILSGRWRIETDD